MPLSRSGLSVYIYSSPKANVYPTFFREVGSQIRSFEITSVSPGGYGQLTAEVPTPYADALLAQIGLFARVAVMDNGLPVWLGELTDPEGVTDQGQDSYIRLTALGIGNSLRDDPLSTAALNQTASQILATQLTTNNRGNSLPISGDTTAIFPDAPVNQFTTSYTNATIEEVVNDVTVLQAGATGNVYAWGVFAHPTQLDGAGFPLGQLVVHLRDTTTTHYVASLTAGEVSRSRIWPAADRLYNIIKIAYYDPASGGYGVKIATDTRLGGSGTQGTAPVRPRVFFRDLSGTTTVTAAVAQTIANTYLTQFQNGQNKASFDLRAVRDTNGNSIPLHWLLADHNIFIGEVTARGQAFQSAVQPGVNQFYIVQGRYVEDTSGGMSFTIDGDNYVDRANYLIARLQNQADKASRTGGNTTGAIQALGAPIKGKYAIYWDSAPGANAIGNHVQFPAVCQQTPTSITFSVSSASNAASPAASNISSWGFDCTTTCNHSGGLNNGFTQGHYTTVGNTLLKVDAKKGTLDWHCQGCHQQHEAAGHGHQTAYTKASHTGLALHGGALVVRHTALDETGAPVHRPGATALAVACPDCGMVESFNTALTEADTIDDGTNSHRAEQATRIRTLMAAIELATA